MSERELKQNLLRFIMYTLTERCDDVLHNIIIDECVDNDYSKFTSTCNVVVDREKNKRQKYRLSLILEKVK